MFCKSRASRRAVAVLFVVPSVFGAACASKSDADLFDSTPQPFAGRSSAGGSQSGGGSADPVPAGGKPATGGAASNPVPPRGGGAGDPSGGGPGDPSGPGGASDGSGGVTSSTGGKPLVPAGGKSASSGGAHAVDGGSGGISTAGGVSSTGGVATGGKPACEPEPELCDGVDNDCDDETDEDTCSEGCTGFTLEGSRYLFCAGDHGGSEAHEACRDAGMHLAWVETEDENVGLVDRLAELMNVEPGSSADEEQAQVRLGGSDGDQEGEWRWEQPGQSVVFWKRRRGGESWEGAAVDDHFSNWSERRPNGGDDVDEDCVVLEIQDGADGDAGQWNDIRCNDEYPFVCEE